MRIDVIPKKCGTKAVSSGRHGERRRVRHRTVDTLKEEIETLESESTEMRKKKWPTFSRRRHCDWKRQSAVHALVSGGIPDFLTARAKLASRLFMRMKMSG